MTGFDRVEFDGSGPGAPPPGGMAHGPSGGATIRLAPPDLPGVPAYAAALRAGWSANSTRDTSGEQLRAIEADAPAFVSDLARHEGGVVTLGDGREVPRLPGRMFWIWEDAGGAAAFCGSINLRHVPGTLALPPHVSGHAGYAVVPWMRGRGVATRALALLLPVAAELGLPRVLVTCDVDNDVSRRVIERNGGVPTTTEEPGKLAFWLETGGGR